MATIVQAVTAAVNQGNDTYWAVHYSQMNNWERNEFMGHQEVAKRAELNDLMRMETLAKSKRNKWIWAC